MTPYDPATLPLDLNYSPLVGLVGRANAALARFDGLLQGIVNPAVLTVAADHARGGAVEQDRGHPGYVRRGLAA